MYCLGNSLRLMCCRSNHSFTPPYNLSFSISTEDQLIASFQGSDDAAPQDGWTILQWSTSSIIPPPQSLRFKFQLRCDENFFGEGCTKECSPRDDDLGHYECDDNGNTVCKQGWRGEYCSKGW